MDENLKNEIENNKYIKEKRVDHFFILNNFGNCVNFLNEMTQTVGITPIEHDCLTTVSQRKVKWESRGGHWTGIFLAILHARFFVKTKYSLIKLIVALSYPIFCFEIYYNFGRQLGNFLIMPKNLNDFLQLNYGKSIQSIQTHLFVKRCVLDNFLLKKGEIKPASFADSYFISQVFGKSYARINKFKRIIMNFRKKNRNIDDKISDN